MTTITLFPCSSAIVCGPCEPCKEYHDLIRLSPDARVVYVAPDGSFTGTLTGGTVTYTVGGGGPTTSSMSVVAATHKLCLGRNQSVNGPLVYTSGVPAGAVITSVVYDYTIDSVAYSAGGTSVTDCTNYPVQIIPVAGSLDCYLTPTVVTLATTCVPCTENTGTSSSTVSLSGGGYGGVYLGLTCLAGGTSCSSTSTTNSAFWGTKTARPPTWTPGATSRPCNWTSLAFVVTLDCSFSYSGAGTPSGGFSAAPVTFTKTAGSDVLTTSAATNNVVGFGCVTGYDQLVRTNYLTQASSPGEYEVPCTGYKLRLRGNSGLSDACVGGARVLPSISIIAELMPR